MQLKQFANLTGALAAASCALLGTEASADPLNSLADGWKFDTALLFYGESDGRVKAGEGIIAGHKTFNDNELLDLKVTVDTLTGASPTGAVPQPTVQTFTRPSGSGNYQVAPGETPLDDTFKDTRVQLNGQWTQPWAELYTVSAGLHLSKEYDYLSLGFNGNISRDFDQKNTTVSAGMAFSHDTISPEGGRPLAFASMVASAGETNEGDNENSEHDLTRSNGSGTKDIVDLLLGVTQVINRQMLMQFNYSYSRSSGYMTDPFKLLSVVDNGGLTQDLLYENRPDDRTKQSFYWQTKYHFVSNTVADISYRYMTDDWGIKSNTVDSKLRFTFDGGSYIEPHLRYYQQGAADFYQPFLRQGELIPAFASADYRIGEFDAYTVGIKYAMPLTAGRTLGFRLEYYRQTPNNQGFNPPGVLSGYDLNPSVSAIILQMSYSF